MTTTLQNFANDEDGFTGAEKALFALLALALILFVGKFVRDGSKEAAEKAKAQLTDQKGAKNLKW